MSDIARPSEASNDWTDAGLSGDHIVSLHAGYKTNGVYTDAFIARPSDNAPRPAVVLLSGMFGLSWTQREITRYYARQGSVADCRQNMWLTARPAITLTASPPDEKLFDVASVVENALVGGAAFLRSLPSVGPQGRIGIMGFCLGGGVALLAMARSRAFQAGVIYHQSSYFRMPASWHTSTENCSATTEHWTIRHRRSKLTPSPKPSITIGSHTKSSFTKAWATAFAHNTRPTRPCRLRNARRRTFRTSGALSFFIASLMATPNRP